MASSILPTDNRPHSRACGIALHPHGIQCSRDCPTCSGAPESTPTEMCPVCGEAKYVGQPCPRNDMPGHDGNPGDGSGAPEQPITEPCIAVPAGFLGSDAEAVALAVAGAVQAIVLERDSWRSYCASTRRYLQELADMYPRTSFAGPETALEGAKEWLAYIGQYLDGAPAQQPEPPA